MSSFNPAWMYQEVPSQEVSFGRGQIRGRLFQPLRMTHGPAPAVVLGHDLSGVKEQDLLRFAEFFARAGFYALAFDYRTFGESAGEAFGPAVADLRQLADPLEQIEDYRAAVAFLRALNGVHPDRVGLWGAGLAGGHVLMVAADDPLIGAVVSQSPIVSGRESVAEAPSAAPHPIVSVTPDADHPDRPAVFSGADARRYFETRQSAAPSWRNELLRGSVELVRSYEPIAAIGAVSAPLLMVLAADDDVGHADLQVLAYRLAAHPKRLHVLQGGHFSFYDENFQQAANAASAWFSQHLHDDAESEARLALYDSLF
jgi:hypothetical protein